ncbi:Cloroperoxidase [Gloeophyllum trabeum ATCC 11539]|uniref:Cloroperoxidase n=1 Tax=Gloeophyllum trabeum (strain ATCC 11539 / FP-39264 / Madison 617) TaxID=670483 RepID=S7PTT2_GLOTA|nr:Cloroperoxidase [Gloeophyllum trabeum ATCC 11539]EPQ50853.1 Cloroperoxidase [Gloeophyllum trabeum ATCC 11539]
MSSSSARVRAADAPSFVVLNGASRLLSGLASKAVTIVTYALVFAADFVLALLNLVLPEKKEGEVGPGRGGLWPEYRAPDFGQEKPDSRCSCPALNALANHGILPRSGRRIPFQQLTRVIRETYNFGPTFCFFVPWYAAGLLGRSYWADSFDLADLDVHNGIEHDASLTRDDTAHARDQGVPAPHLVEFLLAHASGPPHDGAPTLTAADLSEVSGKRRVNARAKNGQFSLSAFHKMFGSSNSATLLTIFGGSLPDLRALLLEERLPRGWAPRCRRALGLTFAEFNATVLRIEAGVHEEHDVMMWRVGRPRALAEKMEEWMEGKLDSAMGMGAGEALRSDSGVFVERKDE